MITHTNKGTVAWFARNPVAANFLLIVTLVGGFLSLLSIEKQSMPDIKLDLINIQVAFPGATPFEVERGICIKIEEAIQEVEGIKEVIATAEEGMGTVTAEVASGYTVSEVMDEINFQVGAIFTFPEEAEEPIISRVSLREDVIDVQLFGDLDEWAMTELIHEIRDEIVALPEVTQAEVNDARSYEIAIEVSEEQLQKYKLSLEHVAAAVRNTSIDLPGGVVRTDSFDIRLRTEGKAYVGDDFRKILLITTEDGARIQLGDVAQITDGFVEDEKFPRFDQKPSLSISVYSVGNENDLAVAAAVRDYVDSKNQSLPDSVTLTTWADDSYYLKGRIHMMLKNLGLGALLVFLLLGFFLKLKVAFWVVVGIPLSFLGAIWSMPFFDVTVNMISLFGFILVLGILVDDAIVIGENIYATVERKGATIDNVISGAQEVALPATFGVLTTMAAFIPMTMVTGQFGPLWKAIGVVVILALAFSLIESKWVLPSHLVSLCKSKAEDRQGLASRLQQWIDERLSAFIKKIYRPFLEKALQYRYVTLAGFISAFVIALGAVYGGWVRFVFFPDIPSDYCAAKLVMSSGTSLVDTRAEIKRIENAILELDANYRETHGAALVHHVRAKLNNRRTGQVYIELSKGENRQSSAYDVARDWSEAVGDIVGAESFEVQASINQDGGADIALELVSDDLDRLQIAAEDLAERLRAYTGVFNVKSSLSEGNPEIVLSIKPEAEAMGLTLADIARQVRHGFYGVEAQRIQRGDDEIKVMVRYPQSERRSLHDLETMRFRTVEGKEIPFRSVAQAEFTQGYTRINRVDGKRTATITASADKAVVEPGKIAAELRTLFENEMSLSYPGVTFRLSGQSKQEEESLQELFRGMLFALFIIYALMAIPLKSYLQPVLIMSVIPFGFIGAVVGHWFLGLPISVLSLCGLIALAGVVVNDSLVMVDFVNKGRARGLAILEAAREAGVRRFRAILLTSMTTFVGLIPIITERSLQAQIVIPMAVTLAFGILFTTVVTLVLIPTLYLVAEDFIPSKS